MNAPSKQSKRAEVLGLIAVGILLLTIAVFFDPIGSSPDTGILDLGSNGTKWLLGVLGACFIAAGFGVLVKGRDSK